MKEFKLNMKKIVSRETFIYIPLNQVNTIEPKNNRRLIRLDSYFGNNLDKVAKMFHVKHLLAQISVIFIINHYNCFT